MKMGGTEQELIERRGQGEKFQEFNTSFTLNDAKVVTKARQKASGAGEDEEDEIPSRQIIDRNTALTPRKPRPWQVKCEKRGKSRCRRFGAS